MKNSGHSFVDFKINTVEVHDDDLNCLMRYLGIGNGLTNLKCIKFKKLLERMDRVFTEEEMSKFLPLVENKINENKDLRKIIFTHNNLQNHEKSKNILRILEMRKSSPKQNIPSKELLIENGNSKKSV